MARQRPSTPSLFDSPITESAAPPPPPGSTNVALHEEAQSLYLNYALLVITSRARPDVRDGLKPVQRRILYAMLHDSHLRPDAKYRKCANVIGAVLEIGRAHV